MMKTITVDTSKINDKKSFHQEFKDTIGFPDYYGMNWDAWIDCMTNPEDSKIGPLERNQVLCLELLDTENFNKKQPSLMKDLIECTSLVNKHYKNYSKENISVVLKFL